MPIWPSRPDERDRVAAFGDWLTAAENSRFTKVIVNRLWKQAFGIGLSEPIDELTDQTPISNPELLASAKMKPDAPGFANSDLLRAKPATKNSTQNSAPKTIATAASAEKCLPSRILSRKGD